MTSYRNSDPRPPIMQGSPPPAEWRVPPLDWDRPPWNRWTFQNVSQILPTATVQRGQGPVNAIEEDLQEIGGVEFTAADGRELNVDAMLDETYTDGFMVVKGGAIVHETYYNGMTPHSLHLSQSVAKSVTATGRRHSDRQGASRSAGPGHRLSSGTERDRMERGHSAARVRYDKRHPL